MSLGDNQAAENEERGGEQTDCMSEAGRMSGGTPAKQHLNRHWNDVAVALYVNEAGEATHAQHVNEARETTYS